MQCQKGNSWHHWGSLLLGKKQREDHWKLKSIYRITSNDRIRHARNQQNHKATQGFILEWISTSTLPIQSTLFQSVLARDASNKNLAHYKSTKRCFIGNDLNNTIGGTLNSLNGKMTEDDLWNNMSKNIYDASYKILPKPLPRAWVKKSSYHQPIVREWSERSNEGEEQTEDGDSKRFHVRFQGACKFDTSIPENTTVLNIASQNLTECFLYPNIPSLL